MRAMITVHFSAAIGSLRFSNCGKICRQISDTEENWPQTELINILGFFKQPERRRAEKQGKIFFYFASSLLQFHNFMSGDLDGGLSLLQDKSKFLL